VQSKSKADPAFYYTFPGGGGGGREREREKDSGSLKLDARLWRVVRFIS